MPEAREIRPHAFKTSILNPQSVTTAVSLLYKNNALNLYVQGYELKLRN